MKITVGETGGGGNRAIPWMARKLTLCSFTARAHQMRTYTHMHTLIPSRALSRSLSHTHIYTHIRPLTHIYKQHTLSHPHFRSLCLSHSQTLTRKHTCKSYTCAPHQQPWTKPCARTPTNTRSVKHEHSQRHVNKENNRVRFTSAQIILIHSIRYTVCLLRKQNNVRSSVTMYYLTVVLTHKLTCSNHSSEYLCKRAFPWWWSAQNLFILKHTFHFRSIILY